jgi:hypothetical protein
MSGSKADINEKAKFFKKRMASLPGLPSLPYFRQPVVASAAQGISGRE